MTNGTKWHMLTIFLLKCQLLSRMLLKWDLNPQNQINKSDIE